jgi:hypothetical protein
MKYAESAMPPENLQFPALAVIEPIESIQLATYLDGSNGTNRASGNRPQIAANTDVDAIKAWIARFIGTKTTFDNYRKEAERLLLWSSVAMQKPISSLTHEDLLVFQRFLADPRPASLWIMPRGRKFARSHPDWGSKPKPSKFPVDLNSMHYLGWRTHS